MTWLEEYKQDIVVREWERCQILLDVRASGGMADEELREVIHMIVEGTSDSEKLQKAADVYWRKFGPQEIEAAQKDAAIQRRLMGLYVYLEHATYDEWEEYARMIVNTRLLNMDRVLPLLKELNTKRPEA
jgi:hypothetical protein